MPVPYADLQNLNQDSGFVELYTLDCSPIGGSIYRFTNFPNPEGGPLYFGGNAYSPLPISTDGWDFSSTGTPPKPKLTISNASKTFLATVISLGDIVGATVTRVRTYAKYLDAASFTRRNLMNYSEDLRNTAEAGSSRPWTQYNDAVDDVIVTYGHLAPNGTNTASKLAANSAGLQQRQIQQGTALISNNDSATHSVYAKAGEARYLKVYIATKTSPIYYPYVVFDLVDGQITWTSSSGSFTLTGAMEDAGDGWYRCVVTLADVGSGPSNASSILQITNNSFGNVNYTAASAGDGLYLWGDQLEIGTSATAYQYTSSSHQPFADSTKYIGPEVYVVEQKTGHNNEFIQWQLTSILDRFGTKLPRRQVLKDKGFPGVARTRVTG